MVFKGDLVRKIFELHVFVPHNYKVSVINSSVERAILLSAPQFHVENINLIKDTPINKHIPIGTFKQNYLKKELDNR